MKIGRTVRILSDHSIPLRYWGRRAVVVSVEMARKDGGKFAYPKYVVKPKNKKGVIVVYHANIVHV